jgi:ATP-binding cassette subfamily B protein
LSTARSLFELARCQPWRILLLMAAWAAIIGLLPVAHGLVLRSLFDTLSGAAPAGLGFWTLLALLTAIPWTRALGILGVFTQEIWVTETVMATLRRNVVRALMARPGAAPMPLSPGEAVGRLRDDVEVVAVFLIWAPTMLGRLVFAVGALTVMYQTNPLIAVGVALPLVLLLALSRLAIDRQREYRRRNRDAAEAVTAAVGEAFGAVQAIKVADAEARIAGHFARLGERRRGAAVGERMFFELWMAAWQLTVQVTTGIVLLLSVGATQSGRFTVGDLALFVNYVGWLSELAGAFGMLLSRWRLVGVSLERLEAMIEGAPKGTLLRREPVYLTEPAPLPTRPIRTPTDRLQRLDVVDLAYRHRPSASLREEREEGTASPGRGGLADRREPGVFGITFSVERGELVAITGPVGSGKTTLLRALLGLLPREGQVLWNGHPVDVLEPPRAAYTPQTPRLFSETLRENLLLGVPANPAAVDRAVRRAVLEPDLLTMPDGLETLVGPKGVRLSGGQVQRAAAARTFVRDAELLVFDDLSSALDVETERVLWERLFAEPGATVIAVSHRPAVLERADKVLVLRDGRLATV